MTTELQADVDSPLAVDVVAVTVTVPYHLELATAALGAGNNATRSPPRPTRTLTFIEEVAPHVRERVTERPASSLPRPTTSRGPDR